MARVVAATRHVVSRAKIINKGFIFQADFDAGEGNGVGNYASFWFDILHVSQIVQMKENRCCLSFFDNNETPGLRLTCTPFHPPILCFTKNKNI